MPETYGLEDAKSTFLLSGRHMPQSGACPQVLQQAVAASDPAQQLQVLRSVRLDATQPGPNQAQSHWPCACIAAVLPGALSLLHQLFSQSQTSLSTDQLQVQCTAAAAAQNLAKSHQSVGACDLL